MTSGLTAVRLMRKQSSKDWFDSRFLSCVFIEFIFVNAASQVYVDPNMVSTYMANVFSVLYSWGQATQKALKLSEPRRAAFMSPAAWMSISSLYIAASSRGITFLTLAENSPPGLIVNGSRTNPMTSLEMAKSSNLAEKFSLSCVINVFMFSVTLL